jgi:hypothetical protein
MYFRMFFVIGFILLSGCTSVTERVQQAQPYSAQITWPKKYAPMHAVFYVHNKIEINAPPQKIWDLLIQAETWPQWYEGAFNVDVVNNESGVLEANSIFKWKTMGLDFTSTIKEFKPPFRLSWESNKYLINGYHAWLLIPTEKGTLLITDESQHGLLAYLQSIFLPNKLRNFHDIWLAEIKKKAED